MTARQKKASKTRKATKPASKSKRASKAKPEFSGEANALSASEVARTLQEIAQLLEITGANAFKVRAYENAARVLPGIGDELQQLVEAGELHKVRGIGGSIAEKVAYLTYTGQLAYFEELKAQVPPGLLQMLRVPGLGPKKIKILYDELGLSSLEELEEACQTDAVSDLKGFGEKTRDNILEGIQRYRRIHQRFLWDFAHEHAAPLLEKLRQRSDVKRAEVAGSLRRRRETVKDVDFVVSTRDPAEVSAFFADEKWSERTIGSGSTKTSIIHRSGLQMDLRVVNDREYPYALHHFTGSKAHNVAMRSRALKRGMKINEYGLFDGEELVPCKDEAEIFAALELQYVPPEMREDLGEIEAAANGELPTDIVTPADVRGVFGLDGRAAKPESLLRAAKHNGWEFVGFESEQPVRWEHASLRLLRGLRCRIEANGNLSNLSSDGDYDYIVAGVQDHFDLEREAQTRRLLTALSNPALTILATPTARLLEEREAMLADWGAIFAEAAKRNVLLQINAQPQRLDPGGERIKAARDQGVRFAIAVDASEVDELNRIELGIGMARRGWLSPAHLANCWSPDQWSEFKHKRRTSP